MHSFDMLFNMNMSLIFITLVFHLLFLIYLFGHIQIFISAGMFKEME